MKAQLMLEWINRENALNLRAFSALFDGQSVPTRNPWVARITGRDSRFGLAREFLDHSLDFAQANSAGSRGVRTIYILESGHPYEVSQPVSWKRTRRYFCTVSDEGDIVEISRDDVLTMVDHKAIDEEVEKWKRQTGKSS